MSQLLLKQILDELLDTNSSLSGPMMKLYYFAKETKNQELTSFLEKELKGYVTTDNIPNYRKIGDNLW